MALAYRDPDDPAGFTHLFTGDSLFPGGVGNTKNPGQSFDSLYRDVTERVFDVYDDDTWVYRGTARTPRSAWSARTSPSGEPAAGRPARGTSQGAPGGL